MERNIRLDWKEIITTAKATRKELGLTQERLAAIAGVSTPAVSRFEAESEKIELVTVFKILEALGMLGHIRFQNDERWDGERHAVSFSARYGGKDIVCLVSLEAIEDNLGDPPTVQDKVRAVVRSRSALRKILERKIRAGTFTKENTVLVSSRELSEALAQE